MAELRFRRHLAAVAAVSLVQLLVLAWKAEALLPGHPDWARPWDHQKYLAMALDPSDMHIAPFTWRVLEPLLVRLLPFDPAFSFRVLAFLAVWATAVLVFVLVCRFVDRALLAWVGFLLFLSLGWLTGYPFYNFWLPDSLAVLGIVTAAIAAKDRRPVVFCCVLLVGVLAKEQVLLAAPLWLTFARGLTLRRLLAWTGLVAPALVALLVVRHLLPAGDAAATGLPLNRWDELPQDPVTLFGMFGRARLPTYPALMVDWTVGAFGTLTLLTIAGGRRSFRRLAPWAPYVVLVFAQPLLASNTKRLVALAFPVAIIGAVYGLAALQRRWRLPDAILLAVPLVLILADDLSPTNVRFGFEVAAILLVLIVGRLASSPGLAIDGTETTPRSTTSARGGHSMRSTSPGRLLEVEVVESRPAGVPHLGGAGAIG